MTVTIRDLLESIWRAVAPVFCRITHSFPWWVDCVLEKPSLGERLWPCALLSASSAVCADLWAEAPKALGRGWLTPTCLHLAELL